MNINDEQSNRQPSEKRNPESIGDLLSEVASGHNDIASALEESLKNPVAPIVYTPEEERFPPLINGLEEKPSPPVPLRKRRETPQHRFRGDWRHDIVTAFFLLMSLALGGYFIAVWQDPYAAWNPLALPTPFVLVTWTPDPYAGESSVTTLEIQPNPPHSQEEASENTAFPAPLNTPPLPEITTMPFTLDSQGIRYAANENGRGCNWASIAGTVTSIQGDPLKNYAVHIVDAQAPDRLNIQVFSGAALTFGESGFEFNLGSTPREGRYVVQLLSPSGRPVSDELMLFTRDSCEENVVLVHFIQVKEN